MDWWYDMNYRYCLLQYLHFTWIWSI